MFKNSSIISLLCFSCEGWNGAKWVTPPGTEAEARSGIRHSFPLLQEVWPPRTPRRLPPPCGVFPAACVCPRNGSPVHTRWVSSPLSQRALSLPCRFPPGWPETSLNDMGFSVLHLPPRFLPSVPFHETCVKNGFETWCRSNASHAHHFPGQTESHAIASLPRTAAH